MANDAFLWGWRGPPLGQSPSIGSWWLWQTLNNKKLSIFIFSQKRPILCSQEFISLEKGKQSPLVSNWADFLNSRAPVGGIGNYCTQVYKPQYSSSQSCPQELCCSKVLSITDRGGGGGAFPSLRIYILCCVPLIRLPFMEELGLMSLLNSSIITYSVRGLVLLRHCNIIIIVLTYSLIPLKTAVKVGAYT